MIAKIWLIDITNVLLFLNGTSKFGEYEKLVIANVHRAFLYVFVIYAVMNSREKNI